ncbi:glycoside hydrolase family 99-like domain-containing protein [Flavobacteriaceae bacterium]|nr:glycoside hydrolase family 99-like domain-containing protein [Flavobacteriaceae bacterium]
MKNLKIKIFAYYLPQYHPIKENDEWWGKGFTEWVSVAKARALFKGHNQPLIPEELGFYDLRLSETREHQAKLAKNHGISSFCYWHYWFEGRRLLERPFNEVLESKKPDFPFFLAWANHSWKGVFFGSKGNTLIKQTYGGKEDFKNHFNYLLNAFKDKRYTKINGKPVVLIYQPKEIPDCKKWMSYWRDLAKKNGFPGLHLIGENLDLSLKDYYGMDAVTYSRHRQIQLGKSNNKYIRWIQRKILKVPFKLQVYSYADAMKYFLKNKISPKDEYPSIVPNWDTTARLQEKACILHGSTPELFGKHVEEVFNSIKQKQDEDKIVFLKSWNEWAEGNYIEPDTKFGRQYLEVLKNKLVKFNR